MRRKMLTAPTAAQSRALWNVLQGENQTQFTPERHKAETKSREALKTNGYLTAVSTVATQGAFAGEKGNAYTLTPLGLTYCQHAFPGTWAKVFEPKEVDVK